MKKPKFYVFQASLDDLEEKQIAAKNKENDRPQGGKTLRAEQSTRSLFRIAKEELGIPDDYTFTGSKGKLDCNDDGKLLDAKTQLMSSAVGLFENVGAVVTDYLEERKQERQQKREEMILAEVDEEQRKAFRQEQFAQMMSSLKNTRKRSAPPLEIDDNGSIVSRLS